MEVAGGDIGVCAIIYSEKILKKFRQNFGHGANMADWQENSTAPNLGEEETVLAIRLAEALRTDEVDTFLEIYDSIPSTTETKRVSIFNN